MIFAPQVIVFVQSSDRCLSAHRRVTVRVFIRFSMILPLKIPISLQKMEDEYIVNNDVVTISLHMHLE
jgi:hypothetical protein